MNTLLIGICKEKGKHTLHPAQLCSLFCASPGQSKRGGWRQRTAREPSCSGAFQVGGTTHGGRKELGDRDEPEVEDGE